MNGSLLFESKTIVFGRNFHQVLPVQKDASMTSIAEITVKRLFLWSYVQVRNLTMNLCANDDDVLEWLLKLG